MSVVELSVRDATLHPAAYHNGTAEAALLGVLLAAAALAWLVRCSCRRPGEARAPYDRHADADEVLRESDCGSPISMTAQTELLSVDAESDFDDGKDERIMLGTAGQMSGLHEPSPEASRL